MITIEQINGEIAVLEEEKPTHVVMQKLASLYIVRDHMGIGEPEIEVPVVSKYVTYNGTSDFARAIKDKDVNEILPIIDELMETLNAINPRLYEGVMRQIL